jgi:hypothetical protein
MLRKTYATRQSVKVENKNGPEARETYNSSNTTEAVDTNLDTGVVSIFYEQLGGGELSSKLPW